MFSLELRCLVKGNINYPSVIYPLSILKTLTCKYEISLLHLEHKINRISNYFLILRFPLPACVRSKRKSKKHEGCIINRTSGRKISFSPLYLQSIYS